jgi:hypothetical protein
VVPAVAPGIPAGTSVSAARMVSFVSFAQLNQKRRPGHQSFCVVSAQRRHNATALLNEAFFENPRFIAN